MDLATGELPKEPAVDRAETKFTIHGSLLRAFHVIKNPAHFCAGKIGIEAESGFFADPVLVLFCFELAAEVSGAAILTILATWLPLRAGIQKIQSVDF